MSKRGLFISGFSFLFQGEKLKTRLKHKVPFNEMLPHCLIIGLTRTASGSDGKESACKAGDPDQSLDQEDPLEKGTATHSSILPWKIPWTEKPGRLQYIGSQRVRQD